MMGFFRSRFFKGAVMWIMAIVFAAMFGLVVAGVDPSAMFGGGTPWVVKVNGEKVDANQYQMALRTAANRQQIQSGDNDLHTLATNDIVQGTLLFTGAKEYRVAHDKRGLKRAVSRDPELGKQYSLYTRFARDGTDPLQALWLNQMQTGFNTMLRQLPEVSSQEIHANFEDASAKAAVRYIQFPYSQYQNAAAVSDEETRAYYDQNPDQFWQGAAVNVEYAKFNVVSAPAETTEEEIQAYYNRNKAKYTMDEEVKASHILIKDEEDTEEARAATLKKAEELLEQAKAEGADFAALAREHSEDTGSAVNGGDLGWFARGRMVPPFEQAAFALTEKGELSEPVRSQFGVHIIRFEERRKGLKPLAEVRSEIEAGLKRAKQNERALEDIKDLYFEIDSVGAEEALKAEQFAPYKASVGSTGFFSRGDLTIPGLDSAFRYPDVSEAVFQEPVGQWSEPIQVRSGETVLSCLLVRVKEKREEGVKPYEETIDDIQRILKGRKAREAATAAAQRLYVKRSPGESLDDLVQKYAPEEGDPETLSPSDSSEFTIARNGYLPGLGYCRDGLAAAFLMPVGALGGVYEGSSGAVILELKQRAEPDPQELTDEKRQEIRDRLLRSKQNAAASGWLQDARDAAKIEFNARALAQF